MILRISNDDLDCPMMLRIIGLAVNAPTLLSTGAIDSLTCFSFHWPNSCFQNCSTVTSLQYSRVSLRNSLSVSSLEMSSKVVSGRSSKASRVYLKICSSLGPHESPNIRLSTPMTSEQIFGFLAGSITSSGLNATGNAVSAGLKYTTSFTRDSGINFRLSIAKSPCGSMIQYPWL